MSDACNPLRSLTVASPCPEEWTRMDGDEKRRYCGRCRLHVYNLSAMTSSEAADLVEGRDGRLCVRFVRAHDGKVMTTDCPHQAVARRRGVFASVSVLFGLLLFGAFGGILKDSRFAGRSQRNGLFRPVPDSDLNFLPPVMGAVCLPPTSRSGNLPPASSSSTP
jgi:hypothetical protein